MRIVDNKPVGAKERRQGLNTLLWILAMFHQTTSPVIRARTEAAIRNRAGSDDSRGSPKLLFKRVAGLVVFLGKENSMKSRSTRSPRFAVVTVPTYLNSRLFRRAKTGLTLEKAVEISDTFNDLVNEQESISLVVVENRCIQDKLGKKGSA
jgi:hypothetical protein